MERFESSSEYLARCAESFREAIVEAQTLALEGDVGDRLAQALHFASDLLDIIEDGLGGAETSPAARDRARDMRDQLDATRGLLVPSTTLH